MTKTMIILRGPPGSGKTTIANILATSRSVPRVLSLDKFRIVDGRYRFDASREKEVLAEYRVALKEALDDEEECIILDNVHSRRWEYKREEELGKKYGYRVFVLEVQEDFWTCLERMVHPVPFEKLREIFERWEPRVRWDVSSRLSGLEWVLAQRLLALRDRTED